MQRLSLYLVKGFKYFWGIKQKCSGQPLRVIILQDACTFSSSFYRRGMGHCPSCEVYQPYHFLLTFMQVQDSVLQNIHKEPDLPVMGCCILKFEKSMQVNIEVSILERLLTFRKKEWQFRRGSLASFVGLIITTALPSLSQKFAPYILPVSASTETSG